VCLPFGTIRRMWPEPFRALDSNGGANVLEGDDRASPSLLHAIRHTASERARFWMTRVYRTIVHRRKWTALVSGGVIALQCSSFGSRSVRLSGLLLRSRATRTLARVQLFVIRWVLTGAAVVHLAAGQTLPLFATVRVLNLLFRHETVRRNDRLALLYVIGLFEIGALERIEREFGTAASTGNPLLDRIVGQALLQQSKPGLARQHFAAAIDRDPSSARCHRLLGCSYAAEGRYPEAAKALARSAALMPTSVRAYQNSAARYDGENYLPTQWELDSAGSLLIYDTLAEHAEALRYRGRFAAAAPAYERLLSYQAEIATHRSLPDELRRQLAAELPVVDPELPFRILSYEWVTQLGHLAMLDAQVKMAKLGIVPHANYLVLAPPHKVANQHYLAYFDSMLPVVRAPDLIKAHFPYQRHFGDNFAFVRRADRVVEPWTLAAARAQVAWCEAKKGPLLRLGPEDEAFGLAILERLGIPSGAWYVGLHVRERGFHGEAEGGAGEHRNADIVDYLPAAAEIVKRGGYVLRLGDRTMRALPKTSGVIDYARSPLKSPRMDVFLLASSRFIIGTTSGLTTAAQAFGTPMLLANCISEDWQFWGANVRFILKRMYDERSRCYLPLAQIYRQPLQGLLGNRFELRSRRLTALGNTPDEIRDAVIDMFDIVDRQGDAGDDSHPLMGLYRQAIARNPLVFGAARPALSFLERNQEMLVSV
jgi:putative glycosyltransferase (TIGR04372 family)